MDHQSQLDPDAAVAAAASAVAGRFRGFVEHADLVQEGVLWRLEHPRKMQEYLEDEKPSRAWYRLVRDLSMALEIFAREQRGAALGYKSEDEAYYNEAIIALMLPLVLSGERETPPSTDGEIRSNGDPAYGNTWMAMLLDVEKAWGSSELDGHDRRWLSLYYGENLTEGECAKREGVHQTTAHRHIKAALRRLIAQLGGPKPHPCGLHCECIDAKLRRRPGAHGPHSGEGQMLT